MTEYRPIRRQNIGTPKPHCVPELSQQPGEGEVDLPTKAAPVVDHNFLQRDVDIERWQQI
jgi:hypothetical protein